MPSKSKATRAIAHAVTSYGFAELHRRISSDRSQTAEQRFWSHVGALVAQLVVHGTIEAVGNYVDSNYQ